MESDWELVNQKVHVLVVLDYINHNSGVSSVVMNYYSNIDKLKVQMDFLLYEKPEEEFLSELSKNGSKIFALGHPVSFGLKNYHNVVDKFFDKHQGEYSVVHVHIPNAAFVVLRCAKKYGVKTRIIHSHNSRGADGCIKKVRNFILNKIGVFYANQYFACSKSAGEFLFGKNKLDKVTVIHNAIDLKKFAFDSEHRNRIRRELGIGDELVLGHVGRFSEQKNHRFLIEIAKQLEKRNVDFKMLFLGGGELQEQIAAKVKEFNLEKKVIFAGIVNNVKEHMDAMDIFLLPSLYEGLPCVCVESQANGLPNMLSSNITKEVALNTAVCFLEIISAEEWADMVLEIYANDNLSIRRKSGNNRGLELYDIAIQAKILEEKYISYGNSSGINVNI